MTVTTYRLDKNKIKMIQKITQNVVKTYDKNLS